MPPRVLIPLPDRDFDVTEVAVPWKILSRAGVEVVFATERGATPACDPLLLSGVIFGQLGAEPEAKAFYGELERDGAFLRPLAYADVDPASAHGLLLPGGHAKGMRQYLESSALFDLVRAYVGLERPLAAICHGVVVLARTLDATTGKSVLHDRRTTCLPKYMERIAYLSTAWKLGDYYRTYPEYVEDEVRRALARPEQLARGPLHLFSKGSDESDAAAFVVHDDNYLSGRWPGDAYLLGKELLRKVKVRSSSAEDADPESLRSKRV